MNPVLASALLVSGALASCDSALSSAQLQVFERTIRTNPVVLFGLENFRCTMTAEQALPAKGVCFKKETLQGPSDPMLTYLKCIHADQIGPIDGGKQMEHSYLYVDGTYVGDGFKAATLTHFGNAKTNCGKGKACASLVTPKQLQELDDTIKNSPVALYGWGGCPCTDIARNRFDSEGVCYVQAVWPDHDDPKFKYLQCVYGEENHSFIFLKGKFFGNGFKLDPKEISESELKQLLDHSGARETCTKTGDLGLSDRPIQSCTQSTDGTTTGWTRTGSCNWDPSDGGYHEVCVTMTAEFLKSSAKNDANDLRSVVQPGGHWCICAWAFASAVERDPEGLQGIHLECDKTNSKLRQVYQHYVDMGKKITSPSGATYEASTALEYVNKLCGDADADAEQDGGAKAKAKVPTLAIENSEGLVEVEGTTSSSSVSSVSSVSVQRLRESVAVSSGGESERSSEQSEKREKREKREKLLQPLAAAAKHEGSNVDVDTERISQQFGPLGIAAMLSIGLIVAAVIVGRNRHIEEESPGLDTSAMFQLRPPRHAVAVSVVSCRQDTSAML